MAAYKIPNLKIYGVRNSKLNKAVLSILANSVEPISFKKLGQILHKKIGSFDRASLYRAILRLKEKSLVIEVMRSHFIASINKNVSEPRYLSSCLNCNQVQNLDEITNKIINETLNLRMSRIETVTLTGICNDCDDFTKDTKNELSVEKAISCN